MAKLPCERSRCDAHRAGSSARLPVAAVVVAFYGFDPMLLAGSDLRR